MSPVRRWWTVKEIAEHYGLSTRTIYDGIAAGDLIAHRFGRTRGGVRIADEDRQSWEQRSKDSLRVPASSSATMIDRVTMSELVQKHFGL